ncbi:MAG TPA: ABC transporter permease, partial [Holophagaceae bacterium]|nr:ABC transporter permease [Holophagaceae bacterium]
MTGTGAFRERLLESWVEIRDNLGRSTLQALGIMLGVASVLGGFSITDSFRQRSEALYVQMGGLDKLNVQPNTAGKDGAPTALQMANLGLRAEDAEEGEALDPKLVEAVSFQKNATVRVRSALGDQERRVTGINEGFLPLDGYDVAEGRVFSAEDIASAAPVAVLGSTAAEDFFPGGGAVGGTLRVGDVPVTVIGVLRERTFVFRKAKGNHNMFRWKNRLVAVPATLVQRRMQGDAYHRADRVTFRIPKVDAIQAFSKELDSALRSNHRQQNDF